MRENMDKFDEILERLDRIITLLEAQTAQHTAEIVQATFGECMSIIREVQATSAPQSGSSLAAQER